MRRKHSDKTAKDDFARNLRALCATHRSVADICRRTGINRQQFGRYLNGTYRPSRHNLMRICKVLGVTEADLLLPELEFEEFISRSFPSLKQGIGTGWLGADLEKRIPIMNQNLWKYLGWYSSFSYSFGWPNMIIRSLMSVHRHKGRVFSKTIDRVKDPISNRRLIYKTEGLVTVNAGKIFIVEQDKMEGDGFSLRILLPTPRSHIDFLSGLLTGTSHRSRRSPSAVRVVMQYLGPTVDIRTELAKCGVFKPDVNNINPHILAMINNEIDDGQTVLHPHPI